jgi:hypothetical protein
LVKRFVLNLNQNKRALQSCLIFYVYVNFTGKKKDFQVDFALEELEAIKLVDE